MTWMVDVTRGAVPIITAITPAVIPALLFSEAPGDAPISLEGIGRGSDATRSFQVVSGVVLDAPILTWGPFVNGKVGYNMRDLFCVAIRYSISGPESYKEFSEMAGTDIEQIAHELAVATDAEWGVRRPTLVAPYQQRVISNNDAYIVYSYFTATLIVGC